MIFSTPVVARYRRSADAVAKYVGALLCALILSSCTTSQELSDSEKGLLFTEMDLASYDVEGSDAAHGAFEKTRYIDGTFDFEYDGDLSKSPVYVYSAVSIERRASDALVNEWSTNVGAAIGFRSQGVEEQPIKLSRPIGDRARLAVLVSEGKKIGNSFTALVDKKVVTLILSGIYFDTEADFREMIEPYIARVKAFDPKAS